MRPRETGDIVLVVDDSPDTLRLLTDALEDAGMTVLVALEGAQALAIVGKITPDVILMDALMPSIDGFETTRRLKRNKALADGDELVTGSIEIRAVATPGHTPHHLSYVLADATTGAPAGVFTGGSMLSARPGGPTCSATSARRSSPAPSGGRSDDWRRCSVTTSTSTPRTASGASRASPFHR